MLCHLCCVRTRLILKFLTLITSIPQIKMRILFLVFGIPHFDWQWICHNQNQKVTPISLCESKVNLKILDLYYINTSHKSTNSLSDILHFEWQLICHSENKNVMPPMLCETRLILKFLTFITSIPQLKIPILFLALHILNGN